MGIGYPMLYFLAALQAIDSNLYDAARVDGAGKMRLFWHITIPQIRPVGMVVLLMTTLYSLRVFDIVQVMTRGGPYFSTDVVGTYIYRQAFYVTTAGEAGANLGYASAAALFMGLMLIGITFLQLLAVRHLAQNRRRARLL